MRLLPKIIASALLTGWLCTQAISAHAAIDPALLKPLAGDDPDARIAAVTQIAALANADAQKILNAINSDALYATPAGDVLIIEDSDAPASPTHRATWVVSAARWDSALLGRPRVDRTHGLIAAESKQ